MMSCWMKSKGFLNLKTAKRIVRKVNNLCPSTIELNFQAPFSYFLYISHNKSLEYSQKRKKKSLAHKTKGNSAKVIKLILSGSQQIIWGRRNKKTRNNFLYFLRDFSHFNNFIVILIPFFLPLIQHAMKFS